MAALAADAPEIVSAVTALARGQAGVGAGWRSGRMCSTWPRCWGWPQSWSGGSGSTAGVVLLGGVPGI